jgi:outer membrane protein OmpU
MTSYELNYNKFNTDSPCSKRKKVRHLLPQILSLLSMVLFVPRSVLPTLIQTMCGMLTMPAHGLVLRQSKQLGDILFSADAQFDGNKGSGGSDFVNAGVRYKSDLIYIAAAFYNKELEDDKDENTLGVTIAKSFESLYLAAAYQNIEKDSVDGSTLDVVASYSINETYKIKLGVSKFDDGGSDISSGNYNAYNTTVEWHKTPKFRTFIEYQVKDFEYRETNDQIMVGMRYNFDYTF